MRIAVVGSGAAAAGVLIGLNDFAGEADVTVFERHDPAAEIISPNGRLDRATIRSVQQRLHSEQGRSFPPPKSHFGFVPAKADDMGAGQLWASRNRGGLTTIWGGGMLPFSDRELAGWPVAANDLAPHYQRVAAEVGVCGANDAIDGYFGDTHVNRPPMPVHTLASRLGVVLNREREGAPDCGATHRFIVGASRLALDTRPESPRGCTSLGECMLGCPRSAVWNAKTTVSRLVAERGWRVIAGAVHAFDSQRRLRVDDPTSGQRTYGPFDVIILAAGAIATTAIVLRSGARKRVAPLVDTTLASFPILTPRPSHAATSGHVALSNLTVLAVPEDPAERTLQISVYPVFDHLLRYYLPPSLWPLGEMVTNRLRAHAMIGRVYLGASSDRTYHMRRSGDTVAIKSAARPDGRADLHRLRRSLRAALRGSDLHVPPPLSVQGTSSHYGCTLPYGDAVRGSGLDGAVADGVHVADASVFPDMPALSPTFTIMANACRTVEMVVGSGRRRIA